MMVRTMQVALQGIPDIHKVSLRESKRIVPSSDAPDGYTNDSEWVLDTEGVNLSEVSHPLHSAVLCSPAIHEL